MTNIDSYNTYIQSIFKVLSVNNKPQLIGSAKLKNHRHRTDFDLQEFAKFTNPKGCIDAIRSIFSYCETQSNLFITDFKCGLLDKKPIRWNKNNIRTGRQTIQGKSISLTECLNQKSTIKMDLIVLFNNVYIEFSMNYYFTIGKFKTYHEKNRDSILLDLRNDVLKYDKKGDLYKALKRLFSFYRLEGGNQSKKINILARFFNSEVGFLNKCKGDLKTILILLSQTFRKPLTADISANLMRIKENLHSLDSIDLKAKLIDSLDLIAKRKSQKEMKEGLELLINHLNQQSNLLSHEFLQKNQNMLVL